MQAGMWIEADMTCGLLLCAVEQAAREKWHWQTAWLLTHLPEPPFHLVQRDPDPSTVRPFSKLADPSWTVAAMQMSTDAAKLSEAQKKPDQRWPRTKEGKGDKGKGKGKDDGVQE